MPTGTWTTVNFFARKQQEHGVMESHQKVWKEGRKGIYSLMDYTFKRFGEYYPNDSLILAVGPASAVTDIGGQLSSDDM
jgi:hypothetical protein